MITKVALTTLFILNFNFILYSQVTQEWVARYNGPGNYYDKSNSIVVDNQGNVYVTGGSDVNPENSDYATIKYNSSGKQLWVAMYNGPADTTDGAFSIALDHNNNVYVTGGSIGNGTGFDYATIKYSPSGQELWVRRFNSETSENEIGLLIAIDDSSNIYVAGGYATVKYNSDGNIIWVAKYEYLHIEQFALSAMKIDKLGNVLLSGYCEDNVTHYDIVTIKFNTSGVVEWIQKYDGTNNYDDYSYSIALDSSCNVYVTGQTMVNNNISECITIKYNQSGTQKWIAISNGPINSFNIGMNVKADDSGNVFVAAQSGAYSNYNDFVTIKYNSSGVEQWKSIYNDNYNDLAGFLEIDKLGNVYVAGTSQSSNDNFDFLTIKYNNFGDLQWSKRYDGSSYPPDFDGLDGLAVDSSGNVYVTGVTQEIFGFYDYTTIKYSQLIGIQPISSEIPSHFSLSQNYPNPFNPATKIRFAIPSNVKGETSNVKLIIYDLLGREIATLVNEQLQPGVYEVNWDATNYPSGVYLYRIIAGDYTETKKLILLK